MIGASSWLNEALWNLSPCGLGLRLVLFGSYRWCRRSPKKRYRETISAIPPYCALWGFWCLSMANWVRYPLPFSERFPLKKAFEVEVL